MEAALAALIAREDWQNAAVAANNLSELHLCRGDLDPDEATLLLRGKGRKQRRVPVGEPALAAVDRYLAGGRPRLAGTRPSPGRAQEQNSCRPTGLHFGEAKCWRRWSAALPRTAPLHRRRMPLTRTPRPPIAIRSRSATGRRSPRVDST